MENKQSVIKYVIVYLLLLILFVISMFLRKGWRNQENSFHKQLMAYQSEILLENQDMEIESKTDEKQVLDEDRVKQDSEIFVKFLDEDVLKEGTSFEIWEQITELANSLKMPLKSRFFDLYRPCFVQNTYVLAEDVDLLPLTKQQNLLVLDGYRIKMEHGSVTSHVLGIEGDVYSYISYVPLTLHLVSEKDNKTDTVYYDTYVTYTIDNKGHIRNLDAFERYNGKTIRFPSITEMIADKNTETSSETEIETETETESTSETESIDTTEAMPSANE